MERNDKLLLLGGRWSVGGRSVGLMWCNFTADADERWWTGDPCVVVGRPTGDWLATDWLLCLLFYYCSYTHEQDGGSNSSTANLFFFFFSFSREEGTTHTLLLATGLPCVVCACATSLPLSIYLSFSLSLSPSQLILYGIGGYSSYCAPLLPSATRTLHKYKPLNARWVRVITCSSRRS